MNIKTINLYASILIMTLCSVSTFAAESHTEQAIKHAEAAAKSADGKTIAEHAEIARTHAQTADTHLDAGSKNLDEAIKQGKLGATDLAKKAAEEAVTHLKKAEK